MLSRLILFLVFVFLVGCSAPAQETPVPIPTPQIIEVIATPTFTPTAMPTIAIPTTAPTAFVTAPAPTESAVIPILMYHHLQDLPGDASELMQTWTVAPKNFEAQLNWLAQRGFHTVTMTQLAAHLKRQQALPSKPIVISFDDGWAEQYAVAFAMLKKNRFIGTFFIYTNPVDHNQFLTWTQLQEMSDAGMDIQAHSVTHPHLRAVPADAAFKEIVDSKTTLEKRLGKPVTSFDYPFGEYNAAVTEMVKRAGFESAVTLAAGYKQRADEIFTLHRIRVSYNDTLDDFAKRLP